MKIPRGLLAVVVLLACTDLIDTSNEVVQVRVLASIITILDVSDTSRVFAQVLNKNGDVVPAPIEWLALDTTAGVDSSGLVRADFPGQARIQAQTGTLLSNILNFTIVPRPDTVVIVGEDTLRVLVGEGSSAPLEVRLDTHEMGDTLPANGGRIEYRIVEPDSTQPRSVEFTGQVTIDTVTTGLDGTSTVPVLLNRVAGVTSPDSAIVEITAFRFRVDTVPGSGQRFIIRFDNP
ncbi:MAG: hypothetical protein V3T16_08270 [Gemmatimonadales bacterium]